MGRKVIFENLGRVRYKEAWDYQEELFEVVVRQKSVVRGKLEEETGKEIGAESGKKDREKKQYLLFCEHEHVYTLGRHGDKQNLLIANHVCKSKNIDLHTIDRGGDITYHGPGQLVAYPIIDLESFGMGIKGYISMLEDVVIDTLASYGIRGEKDDKAMGVWIDAANPTRARKVCAIGVRASRFVTMHGLALNVNTDLSYFNYINPCGFRDRGVTSMQKELEREIDFEEVSSRMQESFVYRFEMELTGLS